MTRLSSLRRWAQSNLLRGLITLAILTLLALLAFVAVVLTATSGDRDGTLAVGAFGVVVLAGAVLWALDRHA